MKALAEIGWARTLRFGLFTAAMLPYRRSFVAAGSVVTADVPPGTLVAGVPPRAVRPLA